MTRECMAMGVKGPLPTVSGRGSPSDAREVHAGEIIGQPREEASSSPAIVRVCCAASFPLTSEGGLRHRVTLPPRDLVFFVDVVRRETVRRLLSSICVGEIRETFIIHLFVLFSFCFRFRFVFAWVGERQGVGHGIDGGAHIARFPWGSKRKNRSSHRLMSCDDPSIRACRRPTRTVACHRDAAPALLERLSSMSLGICSSVPASDASGYCPSPSSEAQRGQPRAQP